MTTRTLVAVQLAAIAVLAVVTAVRFHVWAEIDERQHYANVQSIAEDGRYPLQRDLVPRDVQAITDGSGPARDPRTAGLAGRTYEAIQPPLYYVLAAPAFLIPVSHRDKVVVLRFFDLALLAVALALAFLLCRDALGPRWPLGYAAVLAVVLWPGVIVRMTTVSNDVLSVPMGLLVALLCLRAWQRSSPRYLVAAAVALGAAVLTKVSLAVLGAVLVACALALLRRRVPRAPLATAAALVLPALMVLPWAVANSNRYGSFGLVGTDPVVQALFPVDPRLAVHGVLPRLGRLTAGSLPQEWLRPFEDGGFGGVVMRGLVLALLAFGVAGAVAARRRLDAAVATALGLPLVAGVVVLVVRFATGGGDNFFGRYLYFAALPFAAFGACAWLAARRERVAVGFAVVGSAVAAAFWVHLAAAHYFTDLGQKLHLA